MWVWWRGRVYFFHSTTKVWYKHRAAQGLDSFSDNEFLTAERGEGPAESESGAEFLSPDSVSRCQSRTEVDGSVGGR